MSAGTLQSSESRIAVARRGFVSWATAQQADIAVKAVEASSGDIDARRTLNELAHRLRGTGGTLSFTALVEPAGELEAATSVHADPSGIGLAASRLLEELAALSIEDAR